MENMHSVSENEGKKRPRAEKEVKTNNNRQDIIDDIYYILTEAELSGEEYEKNKTRVFKGIGGTLEDYKNITLRLEKDNCEFHHSQSSDESEIKDIKVFIAAISNIEIGVAIYLPEDINNYKITVDGHWWINPKYLYALDFAVDVETDEDTKENSYVYREILIEDGERKNMILTVTRDRENTDQEYIALANILYTFYTLYKSTNVYMRANAIWSYNNTEKYSQLGLDFLKSKLARFFN